MRFLSVFIFLSALFFFTPAYANNLAIANVSLQSQNTGTQTYQIQFDISWANSWYISGAPSSTANWDAAWVFAKFRKYTSGAWGNWTHCTLNNSGNVAASGSQMTFGATGAVYKGIFIYASGAETGSVSWTANQIQWAYGTDGVGNTDKVQIQVFGIEMVYIPTASFYVGTPTANASGLTDPFFGGNTSSPFQITSESAITIANTSSNLYYNNTNTYGGDQTGSLPDNTGGAGFPKGYSKFYIMKYDITQSQYVDFLNTLTATQQATRWATGNFNSYRYFIKKATNGLFGVDETNAAGTDGSATYSLMNTSSDGQGVACNWLSWMDGAAYAAWAALRPMTELEFEKAARGPNAVVDGEFAWGNTTITAPASLTNSGQSSEAPNTGNSNYNNNAIQGPIRVGSFAGAATTRAQSGAGYYGAMDLSGNVWKRVVTVGNSTGRAFIGTEGSGSLATDGNATNSDWPGYVTSEVSGATGSGFRGGTWGLGSTNAAVADRYYAASTNTSRFSYVGFRAVRTSP